MRKIFLLIFCCFIVISCLRRPENPVSYIEWKYPDNISALLQNFENGFVNRNLDVYLSCFDSVYFRFYPDPSIANSPEGELYKNWDFSVEKEVAVNLFNSIDLSVSMPVSLVITYLEFDTTSSVGSCYFEYKLDIVFTNFEQSAVGQGLFKFKKIDNLWYIVEWQDFKKGDSLSWAEIKVNFR